MLSWRLCWSPWGVNHLCSPLSDRLACTPLSSFLLRPGPLAASLLCLFSFYSNSQHLHRTAGSEDVCLPPCADPSASRASSSSTWPGKAAAWTTVLLAEAHPKWYDPHWGLETLSWTMPPKLTFPVITCSDSSKSLRFSTPFLAFPFATQNLPSLPCHVIIFPIVRNGLSSWVRKLGVSHLLSSFPSPLFSASSIPPRRSKPRDSGHRPQVLSLTPSSWQSYRQHRGLAAATTCHLLPHQSALRRCSPARTSEAFSTCSQRDLSEL